MTLRVDVLTIFPALIEHYASDTILARARTNGALDLRVHDLRDGATGVHRSVDDAPYGGGAGMVMSVEPIAKVVRSVTDLPRPIIALTPSGRRFSQSVARDLANSGGFSLLCGRYEGIDQRAIDLLCDDEISIGDYVLAGGELAALVVLEATTRLVPGALGNADSTFDESFEDGLLEYPQYTRPATFEGLDVPPVLLSGDHGAIAKWRRDQALSRTQSRRPDLYDSTTGSDGQPLG